MKIELEPTFRSNIEAVYGEIGKIWLQNLSAHLYDLAEQWDFHLIKAIPNLSYGFVALVRLNENQGQAILKTTPKASNARDVTIEAKWLKCFKRGVPMVYKIDEVRNAYLMEYLEPGNTVKTLVLQGRDEEATRILCQTILDLQSAEEVSQLGLLSDISEIFEHRSKHIEYLPLLKGHLEDSVISKGQALFRDLCADRSHDILLHGDLHHDNILQSGLLWRTIDPHGYIGDPVAEVGPLIYNPIDCYPIDKPLKNIIERRLKIISEMLPFDPEKISAWMFCLTLLSAAWDVEGFNRITDNTAKIALELEKLI